MSAPVRSLITGSITLWAAGVALAIYALAVTVDGETARQIMMLQAVSIGGGITLALIAVLAAWVLGPTMAMRAGYELGRRTAEEAGGGGLP